MKIKELYVKPELWFETEIDGYLYKCKMKRFGFSFISIHIKQIIGMKQKKKYYFFGPIINVPIFETITRSHRKDDIDPVIGYKNSYEATRIKPIIKDIIKQKSNHIHSYKI